VKRVRVLLVPGSKKVVVSSRSPFTVRDAAGKTHKLPAGKQELGPGLKLKLAASTKALPAPLVFSPGRRRSLSEAHLPRHAACDRRQGGAVVNVVGLESYLWGVVPSEMPDTWPAEALKSQAIVARTYALTHMLGGGDFDVYPDTRSQVYGGMPAESDAAREAVDGTAGKVVLYNGELAQTFFFSSSGGRTANVQDVWNGSKPMPYLVSVPDPYDTLSPYHDWGRSSSARCGSASGSARVGPCSTCAPVPARTAVSGP
jgi:stage II sporulation protein D